MCLKTTVELGMSMRNSVYNSFWYLSTLTLSSENGLVMLSLRNVRALGKSNIFVNVNEARILGEEFWFDRLIKWLFHVSMEWLIDRSLNGLTACSIDWLIYWTNWPIDCFIGPLTDWLLAYLISKIDKWINWSIDWLIDRFDFLFHLFDWFTYFIHSINWLV